MRVNLQLHFAHHQALIPTNHHPKFRFHLKKEKMMYVIPAIIQFISKLKLIHKMVMVIIAAVFQASLADIVLALDYSMILVKKAIGGALMEKISHTLGIIILITIRLS